MRERVELKSPVRENRSPGSVRGAPDNRCPYLDRIKNCRRAPLNPARIVGGKLGTSGRGAPSAPSGNVISVSPNAVAAFTIRDFLLIPISNVEDKAQAMATVA